MEYEKCLVQLDEILKYLSNEDLQKIPNEVKEAITIEKDKNYSWKYDKSKTLVQQNLDRKTIAILSYLNMEYLLNDEQKELMRKIHKSNEEKLEKNKHEKYNYNNLFKKANTENIKEEVALVEIKEEKWYKKVFTFLKRFFIKNK